MVINRDYPKRIAALEEELRQTNNQLSLVEETDSFLRSALARAEEKIENEEQEIEYLRAQLEKLRRMLFGTRSEKLRRHAISGDCQYVIGLQVLFNRLRREFRYITNRHQAARETECSDILN